MEKKTKLKINVILIITTLLVFLGAIAIEYVLKYNSSLLSISTFIYWLFLFFWLFMVGTFHIKGVTSVIISFILFFVSALLTILYSKVTAEIIMKYSFVFLIVGVVQNFLEYLFSKDQD